MGGWAVREVGGWEEGRWVGGWVNGREGSGWEAKGERWVGGREVAGGREGGGWAGGSG